MTHARITRTRSTRTLLLALAFIFSLSLGWAMLPASLQSLFMPTASAAGFVVTNTNDSGAGSLRQAIILANLNGDLTDDTITFNIPGGGVKTIKLASPLPNLVGRVTIDGYTQPGSSANTHIIDINAVPLIELDGTNAGQQASGLTLAGSKIVVRGLIINRFTSGGILLVSNSNVVEGNFIGTDATGTLKQGNAIGVFLQGVGADANRIGGTSPTARNVISGNHTGVLISDAGASGNVIQGNLIGTDKSGQAQVSNHAGVRVDGSSNTVGGVAAGARNVISGCVGDGVLVTAGATANTVQGNFIGTNASGTAAIPNDRGVSVSSGTLIGGTASGAGNLISGNHTGVNLQGNSNTVQGNLIGTDRFGAAAIKNEYGVADNGKNNTIGGAVLGSRNVISGNGIGVATFNSSGTVIQGNIIGAKSDLSGALGNDLYGVAVGGTGTTVGASGQAANLIAFNKKDGVYSHAPTASGNTVSGNLIHSNGGLGIKWAFDGVTGNDANDADAGPNGLQNFPVLTGSAPGEQNITLVSGTLNSKANTQFKLEFFANDACDPSGYGEGQKLIGTQAVTTSGNNASFVVAFGNPNVHGKYLAATATDPSGNTSEFSKCMYVAAGPSSVQFSSNGALVNEAEGLFVFTVKRTGDMGGPASVNYATSDGSATSPDDYVATSGTLNFAPGESSKQLNVHVKADSIDEGTDEIFNLKLSNPAGTSLGSPASIGVSITDDDATPSISINDVTVAEGDGGTTDATFTVALSGQSSQTLKAVYMTADATAKFGSDYQIKGGMVSFSPGQTTQTFSISVNGDTAVEPDEFFLVKLQTPANQSGATTSDDTGVATITNDDAEPKPEPTPDPTPDPKPTPEFAPNTFQFEQAVYAAQEDSAHVSITVTRTGDVSVAASVDYETKDGSATDRTEYTTALGTLRFAPGETSKSFDILITEDAYDEMAEEFLLVQLSNPTAGATLGSQDSTTVKVTDDSSESSQNASDDTELFVRQQYHDFLGREADAGGLAFWMNDILSCGGDAACLDRKRQNVSAAFFLSIEFQETGFFVHRLSEASYDRLPRYRDFVRDSREVAQGVVVGQGAWEQQLEANRQAFVEAWVERPEFKQRYDSMTNALYVDALYQNAGITPVPQAKHELVAALDSAAETRAAVLRKVADEVSFRQAETDRAFVLMQYFGYLRRNPDDAPDSDMNGYNFWLQKLQSHGGDFVSAEMVKSFLISLEYRSRFGQP